MATPADSESYDERMDRVLAAPLQSLRTNCPPGLYDYMQTYFRTQWAKERKQLMELTEVLHFARRIRAKKVALLIEVLHRETFFRCHGMHVAMNCCIRLKTGHWDPRYKWQTPKVSTRFLN